MEPLRRGPEEASKRFQARHTVGVTWTPNGGDKGGAPGGTNDSRAKKHFRRAAPPPLSHL